MADDTKPTQRSAPRLQLDPALCQILDAKPLDNQGSWAGRFVWEHR